MARLQPDAVAIQRLALRMVMRGEAAAREQASAVQQELAWADWPEAPGDSWVFVRQVQVRASRAQLREQVVQQARRQVQSGGGADVVRFASLTDLLAALLLDLRQGVAAQRWYWQQWAPLFRLPVGVALVQLLAEHAEQLPAVAARLAQQRQLAYIWQALDAAGAHQLARELAWRSGFVWPEKRPAAAEPAPFVAGLPLIPSGLLQRWGPVLQPLPPADTRRRLGLLLLAQECTPLALQRAPQQTLAALEQQLTGRESARRPVQSAPGSTATGSATQPPLAAARAAATHTPSEAGSVSEQPATEAGAHFRTPTTPATPHAGHTFPADSGASDPLPPRRTAPAPAAATDTSVAITAGTPSATGSKPEHNPARPPQTGAATQLARQLADARVQSSSAPDASPDPDFAHFTTTQGGLLYLLNFLNRPEAQTLLGDFWEQLPGGWAWLARLGRELGLDLTDPLADYLAIQLGLTRGTDLATLAPLPARTELLALAEHWYGRAGLWTPALLRLDARIRATPSHLDLYAPLNAVQLPLRLAGLDFNPGWLPWLGRVVTFHYD